MLSIFHGVLGPSTASFYILFTCRHSKQWGQNEMDGIEKKKKKTVFWGIFMNLSNRKNISSCFFFSFHFVSFFFVPIRNAVTSCMCERASERVNGARVCLLLLWLYFQDDIQYFVVVFRSIKMKRRWVNNLCRFKVDDNHIYFIFFHPFLLNTMHLASGTICSVYFFFAFKLFEFFYLLRG